MSSVSKFEFMSKAHDVETWVHGWNIDAQFLGQSQVSPTQLVHVNLQNVREIDQHMRSSLRSETNILKNFQDGSKNYLNYLHVM